MRCFIIYFIQILWRQNSSLDVMNRLYGLDHQRFRAQFVAGANDFSLLGVVVLALELYPVSTPTYTGSSLHGYKMAGT
jgi:hypothetical protein